MSFAALSIGVTTDAIANRRKCCIASDGMVREALEIGVERLQGQLLDTALRSIEERMAVHDPEPPAIERISAPDAFALLAKQERQLADPPVCSAERASQISDAAARLQRLLQCMRVEAGLPPDAA